MIEWFWWCQTYAIDPPWRRGWAIIVGFVFALYSWALGSGRDA